MRIRRKQHNKESEEIEIWLKQQRKLLLHVRRKLKEAITEILDKTMTSTEKSEYWYKYYIEHKQYNDDLEYNKKINIPITKKYYIKNLV